MDFITRLRNRSTEQFIPIQASLELTNRCNERCTHCYLPTFQDDRARILTKGDWFHILDQLRSAGSLYLILMGGEAMLSPHFWPILQRAAKLGFHVSMISNGLKINSQEVADRLASSGLQQITISFYSLNEEIHDQMTSVKGSCRKTKQAIEFCKAAGIEIGINCLLTKQNISTIFELEDWCIEKNIQIKVDPNVTAKLNGDMTTTQYRASTEQLKWFYSERLRKWPNSRPKKSIEVESSYICNSAKGKCAITAYGELLPCIEIREPLGSLLESDFNQLWFSKGADKWRKLKVGDISNLDKNEYGFCDHCPGMSKNEFGKPLEVSKFSYDVARIKREIANS